MVIAMIAFAIEDAIIKQLALKLPISQVLVIVGLSGLLVLYGLSILNKELIAHRRFINVKFLLRMSCELVSSVFFVITMVYVSLTVSSALLQIVPIMMTIGGSLLFKESDDLFCEALFAHFVGSAKRFTAAAHDVTIDCFLLIAFFALGRG